MWIQSPVMAKERELDYSRSFPTNLTRDAIAQPILNDLGMDGAYSSQGLTSNLRRPVKAPSGCDRTGLGRS